MKRDTKGKDVNDALKSGLIFIEGVTYDLSVLNRLHLYHYQELIVWCVNVLIILYTISVGLTTQLTSLWYTSLQYLMYCDISSMVIS